MSLCIYTPTYRDMHLTRIVLLYLAATGALFADELTESGLVSYLSRVGASIPYEESSHDRSCPLISIRSAIKRLKLPGSNPHVLVHTPCFSTDSFGNMWSNYVEARICANVSGLHYVAPTMRWKHMRGDPYLDSVPAIVFNSNKQRLGFNEVMATCKCPSLCHESPEGLLHKYPNMVRDMFLPPVLHHSTSMTDVRVSSSWRHTLKAPYSNNTKVLPAVPSTAIHYRCGDNTVGAYGFLPFRVIKNRVPYGQETIYILAEPATRKTKFQQQQRCNIILDRLHAYVANHFKTSTVLTLRGANMYDDVARLTLAETVVCSVSTFCFFPALASSRTVYFPVTDLVAKSRKPFYRPNFIWLNKDSEKVLLGPKSLRMDIKTLIATLTAS